MWGALILQIVLIFFNGIFASAEIAVISANETKMQKMAEKGDRRAKRIGKLTTRDTETAVANGKDDSAGVDALPDENDD